MWRATGKVECLLREREMTKREREYTLTKREREYTQTGRGNTR